MHALGLDIGSSSIKGAVLDLNRGTIGTTVSRPFPAPLPGLPAGWFEVEPHAIEAATREVLGELLRLSPMATGLFVAGQMGGTILIDEAGEALTNYRSWRDQRTCDPLPGRQANCLDDIRARWNAELLRSLGNELQPGSTTSLLFWLSESGSLDRRGIPVTIADYLIGRLGERTGLRPTMHVTHAIGMLDLATGEWNREAFRRLGLADVNLPAIIDQIEPQVIARLGSVDVPVFGAYGDQQTALCGAGLERSELSLNISTGSQVSRRTAGFEPGSFQSRRYFFGDCLNTITHIPAGRSLNVLFDLLTELAAADGVTLRDPWQRLMEKVAAVHETNLNIDLSFFAGAFGDTGRIDQITTENLTAGQLFHAAFRNMADNYARCAAQLDPQRTATGIALSGGLTKSAPVLRQMIADRFTQPLRETEGEETLLGLLQLARGAVQ